MNFRDALKWGLYDRVLAVLSLVVGVGIAIGALWFGTGEWFLQAIQGNPGGGPQGSSLAIAAGGVLLGLFVWQLGKAAARHRTIVSATEQRVHARLAGHDTASGEERLAQIESDVEEVRRVASRLEQAMRQGEVGAGDPDAGGAGDASGTASASAASDGAGAAGESSATADDAATADGHADGVDFAGSDDAGGADDASASDDAAADQAATSTADGGTAGDADEDDAFEWAEDDEEGEYYRDA